MLARLVVGAALATVLTAPAAAQRPEIDPVARAWLEAEVPIRWARMVEQGDSLFNNGTCRRCHGDGGVGGRRGPDLTDGEWAHGDGSLDAIFETIYWGVRKKDMVEQSRPFDMNPNGGMVIDWDLTRALAAYVWSLSHPSQ
jgi:mono/diheme cytochrome c family protein